MSISTLSRLYKLYKPPSFTNTTSTSTHPKPLRFGILGAAAIAPNALISPSKTHPDVVIYAVAARSLEKAKKAAVAWGIDLDGVDDEGKKKGKVFGGGDGLAYEELVKDEDIDVVYNALPNALHYKYTMLALNAGKHVLNEKPSADTADETREMYALAKKKGVVLLDAYHYRFHPALRRVKEIVDTDIGEVKKMEVKMILGKGAIKDGDIRFDYDLGGGALMDLGCYTMDCILYMSSTTPTSVASATYEPYIPKTKAGDPNYVPNVDRKVIAALSLSNGGTATLEVDLSAPPKYGIVPNFSIWFKVEGERGSVEMNNFVMPTLYHSITVKIKDEKGKESVRTEKAYKVVEGKGEEWWSTYRYQLDALVDRIRGREPESWVEEEDCIATMGWIEKIYEKIGIGARPRSTFTLA